MERPIVIIAELERVKNRFSVRMHIALTRATEQMVVIASADRMLR